MNVVVYKPKHMLELEIVTIQSKRSHKGQYLLWMFRDKNNKLFLGFTPSLAIIGNKLFRWAQNLTEEKFSEGDNIDLSLYKRKKVKVLVKKPNIVIEIISLIEDNSTEVIQKKVSDTPFEPRGISQEEIDESIFS